MKKKALTIILPLCVAMAITACGGNADTTEVEETTVIEESAEADAQEEAEVEASTVDEEAIEEPEVEEEPVEEIVEEYNPASKYEGKPYMVDQAVLDNDECEKYGVYSESCFDLDQYLDEEGALPGVLDFDNHDWDTYSGRWAYPEVTPSDIFTNLTLSWKTDQFEKFYFEDKSGNEVQLTITSGISSYNLKVGLTDMSQQSDNPLLPQLLFTTETVEGPTDVVCLSRGSVNYDEDGNEEILYNKSYVFHVGNFTAEIWCPEAPEDDPITMSEEDIQEIIDNIRLTNGLER